MGRRTVLGGVGGFTTQNGATTGIEPIYSVCVLSHLSSFLRWALLVSLTKERYQPVGDRFPIIDPTVNCLGVRLGLSVGEQAPVARIAAMEKPEGARGAPPLLSSGVKDGADCGGRLRSLFSRPSVLAPSSHPRVSV